MTNATQEFLSRKSAFNVGYRGETCPEPFWQHQAYFDGQHAKTTGVAEKDASAYFVRLQILHFEKYWP